MCIVFKEQFKECTICVKLIRSINWHYIRFCNKNLLNFCWLRIKFNSLYLAAMLILLNVETRPFPLFQNIIFSSCFIFLTRNSDFTTHALCPNSTTISIHFPSIRETGWNNQDIWFLSTRCRRNYISPQHFPALVCNIIQQIYYINPITLNWWIPQRWLEVAFVNKINLGIYLGMKN